MPRHIQVQNHEIVLLGRVERERFGAAGRLGDFEAVLAQEAPEAAAQELLVVDE